MRQWVEFWGLTTSGTAVGASATANSSFSTALGGLGGLDDTPITGTSIVSPGGYVPNVGGGISVVSEGVTYVADDSIFSSMLTMQTILPPMRKALLSTAGA